MYTASLFVTPFGSKREMLMLVTIWMTPKITLRRGCYGEAWHEKGMAVKFIDIE